jgi:hypothetical protein
VVAAGPELNEVLEAMRADWLLDMPSLGDTDTNLSFCSHLDEYILVQQDFINSLMNKNNFININQSIQD